MLTTASDVLFSGGRDGSFYALDARDGKLLWQTNLGPSVASSPMTYAINGKQYVSIMAWQRALHIRSSRAVSPWRPSRKFCAPGVFEPATYSQGIKVTQAQTILFLSGQVAYTPDGGVACRGDFKGQARGALRGHQGARRVARRDDGQRRSRSRPT